MKITAIYILSILLIGFGIATLFLAIQSKKKVTKATMIADDTYHDLKEEKTEKKEDTGKKTKQQLEVEALLVSNSAVLRTLSKVDKTPQIKYGIFFVLAILVALFNRDEDKMVLGIMLFFLFAIVIVLPGMLVERIIKKKIKRIAVDLPSFIDLVAVSMQVGISIEAALRIVAEDFKTLNPDMNLVMTRTMKKADLSGLGTALSDLFVAVPIKEIRMFCTVLQQSVNFGASVYDQLITLSADIREMQLLEIEEKLGSLAAKMSMPLIIFIMMPIVILIVAPGAMRVLPQAGL